MPFKKRKPPIKVEVSKENFNKLIELVYTANEINSDDVKEKANVLKEKLLKYSIPTEKENVIIRLFPYEAETIIYILFSSSKDYKVNNNYYNTLLETRKNLKERGESNA
ncbi:MAG: hypothetical protein IKG27_05965 [Bacilli bacterium]|nr:hypothetical protein [Bacilli bacterium]